MVAAGAGHGVRPGLNYADHASELEFKAPEEPLVFLKAPNTLTGHRRVGAPGRRGVYALRSRAGGGDRQDRAQRQPRARHGVCGGLQPVQRLRHSRLPENYYRPNLRVKSRDTLTPIGPYIVDRDDVADPHRLALSTYVNGELRQRGSTADMIFDIPFLIAYLSEFMTLQPGDMIATGTPKGLADAAGRRSGGGDRGHRPSG